MRRCFEQLPSRSQLCSHPVASPLSFFRAGQSQKLFIPRLSFRIQLVRTTQTSLSYSSLRRLRKDVPSPPFQGVASTEVKDASKKKDGRKNHIHAAEFSQKGPEDWVAELDTFLPRSLSWSDELGSRTVIPVEVVAGDVLRILTDTRYQRNVDILGFMALNQRRYKAVIHLVEILLKAVALAVNAPFEDELPSNITWPDGSFAKRNGTPIELDRTLHVSRRPVGTYLNSFDCTRPEKNHEITMELIWSLLADLVLASTNRPSDEGKQIMNTVHQILALIHNLGLVPANIYTYSLPQGTTMIQHSPILHLLNSRILSTLSDAVWHAYQDDVFARSGKTESSPWNIFREPPPSRLRPRKPELGPEVWLEFILWCCVEGGFAATGARIVRSMQKDVEGGWQAIHWPDDRVPSIDWDQRTRQGRLESEAETYHREQLSEVNPHKFISAEVILAIADSLINKVNMDVTDDDLPIMNIQNEIRELISFGGLHGLAPAYFDYLAVRLLETGSMYNLDKADSLRNWASVMSQLRSLHPVEEKHRQNPELAFESILDYSELHVGILHQALQACIEANLVKKAVDTFTEIQKIVDGNKLEAIGEFLSLPLNPEGGFFTSRYGKGRGEFLNSYGQLPTYKLPPFLDLVSNAKLLGLGDWLLFSEDVDGAVLPSSTWAKPSVTAAVVRYASAKNDPLLVKHIYNIIRRSDRKPTVNVLRALVVYHVNAREWTKAILLLLDLRRAEGGGYSPKIVASLAAKILSLEVDAAVMPQDDTESDLSQAMLLFSNILDGVYDSPPASFRVDQKKTFRQQVGYLLRLLENVMDSKLADTATRFKPKFPVSNKPDLAKDTFNVLFAAIVETKGVLEGQSIWYLFCKDLRDCAASSRVLDNGCDAAFEDRATDKNEDDFLHRQANDALNDLVGVGGHDRDHFSSKMSLLESPQNSDKAVPHANAQISLAHPASLGIDATLPQDKLDFAGNQFCTTSDAESKDAGIPIETMSLDFDSTQPHLDPIVVPDMRTLQILVRGALAEIQARKERRRSHADLDAVVKWAEQFYEVFNLAREDVETEFRVSPALPKTMKIATQHRRAVYGTSSREKFKPNVAKHFTKGVFIPRRPGIRQSGQNPTQVNGVNNIAEDATNKTEQERRADEGMPVKLASSPNFKVRKFASASA
ncbi:uncharacterized protein Z519_01114 [Cladophialophora bantiana CBS 173.52]|uniref:Uncharacterized protein n=1 Tax=Cladophialophora bantiana (strain ATCC 10958 / CBS 173.52 / CDC B-1940 / NIH 8579) TaxID=1442370 RepID=A0A0D2I300_CLAB1|nr:uncharacterized protein Z519_01114 [Cladophialophora bantiana CBS 173.52]KIW97530.1 hypothetical protein Z519_01114 [Cladophialophora bantiana CBS 173.52]